MLFDDVLCIDWLKLLRALIGKFLVTHCKVQEPSRELYHTVTCSKDTLMACYIMTG